MGSSHAFTPDRSNGGDDERRVRTLAETSALLGQSLDATWTLRTLARHVAETVADCAVCYRIVEGGARIERVGTVHSDPRLQPLLEELEALSPPTPDSPDAIAASLRTGSVVHIPRIDDEVLRAGSPTERHLDLALRIRPRSTVVVPMAARGEVLGILSVVTVEGGKPPLGEAERRLLEEIAAHAALALDNARLFEAERTAREAAETAVARTLRLQAVTAALSRALPRADVLEVIVSEAVEACGAVAGGVVELSEDRADLVLLHSVGFEAEVTDRYRRFPADAPLPTTEVLRTGRPVMVGSVDQWTARYPHVPMRGGEPVREGAWAALPLRVDDHLFGALTLSFPRSRAFEVTDVEFMMALANQCAQALERARLYEAEARARHDAEEANRSKTEFLSSMSHELRTPLNAIGGYVELMELGIHGPTTEAQRQALGRIAQNQKHLLALINDLLNFARIEAGKIEYRVAEIAVGPLLAGVEALIEPQIRAKRLAYTCEPCDPTLRIRGDEDKVQQILLNLLSNAVKFTDAGGSVWLRSERRGGEVRIQVQDSGRGIPEDKQEAIFDAFVQGDPGHGELAQGVGLGLSISRDLARGMGGSLTVRSRPGEGSTFSLILPAAAAADPS